MQRDLSSHDVWEESLRRSRERRERAAAAQGFDFPTKGISVAALVAVTGGPIAGVAVGKVLGDGGDGGNTATAAKPVSTSDNAAIYTPAKPAPKKQKPAEGAEPAAAAPTAQGTEAHQDAVVAAKPKPKPALVLKAATAPAQPKPAVEAVTASSSSTQTKPAVASTAKRKGGGVRALQAAVGAPVDGDFGKATQKALKRWQEKKGLTADGVAGPETRQALGLGEGKVLKRKRFKRQVTKTKRTSRKHSSPRKRVGGGVAGLQRALGLSADGVFGPATEKALKRWQRSHGLTADGVAGPQTRRALGMGDGPALKRKRRGGRRHSSTRGGGGGGSSSTIQGVINAANRIATTPYRYGGGHGSFNDSGYDCSGSVSYALHGGGLLSSPLDSSAFMSYGKPGPGKHITIYANAGHVFMTINGRRFDTSARSQTGSRWGGPRSGAGYVVRHPAGY